MHYYVDNQAREVAEKGHNCSNTHSVVGHTVLDSSTMLTAAHRTTQDREPRAQRR